MRCFNGIWVVMSALLVNAGIAVLLFWLIPPEVRERALSSVEVSISDYRLPEIEEAPAYEVPESESDTASEGAENASDSATGSGTSSAGTGSGGGGASSERLLSEAMTAFSPVTMPHAVKGGPSNAEKQLALDEIMRQMELMRGINSLTAPALQKGTALPPGHGVSASFKGRMGTAGRRAALKKHGGDFKSESAVEKALKYLASQQNSNGSWGSTESFQTGDAAALSGFAMLAFLSHGETFDSKLYGETIKKGAAFLCESANVRGIENAGKGFGHAILTYALAETFAMTGELNLKKPLEERVKAIIARQNKFGSFAENYDNKPTETPPPSETDDPRWKEILIGEPQCDLSLLGWHIQALTAAKNSGIRVEKLDEALARALEALVRIHQAKKGGFSAGINMQRFEPMDNMNPVGLLCLQFLGEGKSAAGKRVERLVTPDKKTVLPGWRSGNNSFPLYRWYYQTQSIFQNEKGTGKTWESWNEHMKQEIVSNQEKTGAWFPPSGDNSFALRNRGDLSLYATSVCALILQVYYRYLPTYSIAEVGKPGASFADQLEKGVGGHIRRLPGGVDPLADLILGVGSQTFDPVQFGAFDNQITGPETPHMPERFKVFASFASTIGVRDVKGWPQTLQPKQRIAVFLDEFLPEDYRNNLLFTVTLIYPKIVYPRTNIPYLEIVLNGRRMYYGSHSERKNFISILLPQKYFLPSGNILQIRNCSEKIISFDGARLETPDMFGERIYLGVEDLENLPDVMRQSFNVSWIPVDSEAKQERILQRVRHARLNGALPLLSISKTIPVWMKSVQFSADVIFEVVSSNIANADSLNSELRALYPKAQIIFRGHSTSPADIPQSVVPPVNDEGRQFFTNLNGEAYSNKNAYWGVWQLHGAEKYGNIFQSKYLERTGSEIVLWLWNGGSGIILRKLMDGGRIYDTSFKTEYPAVSAIKQVSKLFDGNPRKIPLTIYPTRGETPLFSGTSAMASANTPGVVTLVIAKSSNHDEDITLHALVPWNGPSKMVIERGFFDEKSPYAEQYGTLQREESEMVIENNSFEYSGTFGAMTVIRLSQKFASEPKKTKSPYTYREAEIKYEMPEVENVRLEIPKDYEVVEMRHSGTHFFIFGNSVAGTVIPASYDPKALIKFKPGEAESVEISFKTGNKSKRYDSCFLLLGDHKKDAESFTFTVYPKITKNKKSDSWNSVPLIFGVSGKLYRTTLRANQWYRITIPFNKNTQVPNLGYLRIIEPRNILDGRFSAVSYEINHVGVLLKKGKEDKK